MPTPVKEWWKCDRCGKAFADDRGAAEACEAGHARAETSADFGRRLREARRGRRWTLLDVARAVGIPPHEEGLAALKAGEEGRMPFPEPLRGDLARLLGIDP
jgi:hypothetical protein